MSIILASNSPRRKELLAGLGLEFTVKTLSGIDESYPDTLVGEEIPLFISKKKAEAYKSLITDDDLLITADTIVYLPANDGVGVVMGKPEDRQDAIDMLNMLSGRTHEVITAVTILTKSKQKSFAVTSIVSFDELTDSEICYYVDNYKPFDKAGAYGIQEWIGFVGVNSLQGSYFNVMGLPVQRLYKELKSFSVDLQ